MALFFYYVDRYVVMTLVYCVGVLWCNLPFYMRKIKKILKYFLILHFGMQFSGILYPLVKGR